MNMSCPNNSTLNPATSKITILHVFTVYSTIWQKLIPWTVVVVQVLHKCSSEKVEALRSSVQDFVF